MTGCLTVIVIIFSLYLLITKPVAFIGLLLLIWGIYEWSENKKLRAKSKIPPIIVTISCLIVISGFVFSSDSNATEQPLVEQSKEVVTKESSNNNDSDKKKEQEDEQKDKENSKESPPEEQHKSTSTQAKTASTHSTEKEEVSSVKAGLIAATVTRVIDGDTIEVNLNGKTEKVRLTLVDTPETVHPNKSVEPFGPEASEFTTKTLNGQKVGLEMDVQERDKYGRLLAYIWIGDKLFNKMLLEKGLARVSVYPPNVKYESEFRAAQKTAQEKGIGIWSVETYAQEEKKNKQQQKSKTTAQKPQPKQQPASKSESGCSDPKIKGNINSKGEKIYHVPGGAYYDRTIPEEWFCTEAEAQAAGYRASMR